MCPLISRIRHYSTGSSLIIFLVSFTKIRKSFKPFLRFSVNTLRGGCRKQGDWGLTIVSHRRERKGRREKTVRLRLGVVLQQPFNIITKRANNRLFSAPQWNALRSWLRHLTSRALFYSLHHYSTQFSRCRLTTLSNSLILLVTNVISRDRARPAMRRSPLPLTSGVEPH